MWEIGGWWLTERGGIGKCAYINMIWDLNVSVGERLEKGRFSRSILAHETVPVNKVPISSHVYVAREHTFDHS
jgi:hypothetical protein